MKVLLVAARQQKYCDQGRSVSEIGYRNWRLYDTEDTVRFWSLRLREAGVIKLNPKTVLAEATDWRFINELKREMKV
jgi:NitT/TauT family transport system substrate-binding protein